MRVEQQNQILEALQQAAGKDVKTASGIVAEKAKTIKSVSDRQTSIQMKDTTYLNPAREEKKSIAEKIEESSEMDAFERKNQMAVLSNTTSEEDYAKMQEEGFSLDSTDSHTIITVTDKIKMQLAKAGKEVFGDDLDAEQLEVMTGSAALASQLEQAFKEADLPATDENIAMSMEAFEQLQMLQPMTDGAIKYMLDNQLQPTIENLYMAQFSGSAGYTGQTVENMEQLSGQIQNMLSSMGLPVNENTMADCQWLIQNDVPLTEENLTYYEDLKTLELPTDPSQAMGQIADAITEGNMPKDAMVAEGYSLKDQAQYAADVIENAKDEDVAYVVNNGMELTVDNLAKAAENRGKVTAYVGAGGKTSAIRKRAETLRTEGKKVLILTTTKMMRPQEQELFAAYEQTGQQRAIPDAVSGWQECRTTEKKWKEQVQSFLDTYGCCVAGSLIPGTEKFGMLPEKLMEDLLYLADEILIEADGSAHMPVKAPAEHEPVLFPYMDEVVIVMGVHAIGKPLQEVCHRVDYAKKILKCDADKIVTAADIRALAEQGYAIPIQKQFPWMKISKVTGKDIKLCLTAEKKDKERDKQ